MNQEKCLKINNTKLNLYNFLQYRQINFSYEEIPLRDNLILVGDFQSEKFFLNCVNDIKNLFYFDENRSKEISNYLSEIIKTPKITSVHVRRGDYLTKPNYHPVCSVEYYLKSMEIVNDGNTEFIFVSDDIDWCKNNFKGDNIHYSSFTNEIDDLLLLMLCDNHIMSNSSFSWWGTYLSDKKGVNIAPKTWFGELGPQDTNDIYLEEWIVI